MPLLFRFQRRLAKTSFRHPAGRVSGTCLTLTAWLLLQFQLIGNPINPEVIRGNAEFEMADDYLRILQDSRNAVIDWEQFSIGEGQVTEFVQPSAQAAALNRVRGGGASILNGQLNANGQIFLLNPAGILIGQSGRIDVGGFVASTLDLDLDQFEERGDFSFNGGSQAAVVNLGQIGASNGDIFLIGAQVQNLGTLKAPNGTVGLAAGSDVLIKADGEERVFVRASSGSHEVGVDNQGVIESQVAELKAHGGNVYALAIRNEGRIAATGLSREGGKVYLRAGGGKIRNNGSIVARGLGNTGGKVEITAGSGNQSEVEIGEIGSIDVGSEAGPGGEVAIRATIIDLNPGGEIRADGATDGGMVALGDSTTGQLNLPFGSSVTADGRGGNGGSIAMTAQDLSIGGSVGASGELGGGAVALEGSTVRIEGQLQAIGRQGAGGSISAIASEGLIVGQTGILNASGETNGGGILMSATGDATVDIAGQLFANGTQGNGGRISITGREDIFVRSTSLLSTSGKVDGGAIVVRSDVGNVDFQGTALSLGESGAGGSISIAGDDGVLIGAAAILNAGGADGGTIAVKGGGGTTQVEGALLAGGESGIGGSVTIEGSEIQIGGLARLEASGELGGGNVMVGGGLRGEDPNLQNATDTEVALGAVIAADAIQNGNGGQAVVFAQNRLDFDGLISARAGLLGGDGGFVELSGQNTLSIFSLAGQVDLRAPLGRSGTLLIDPTDISIVDGSGAAIGQAGDPTTVSTNTLNDQDIADFLNNNASLIVDTSGGSGGAGDIVVGSASNITWNSANHLTFDADQEFSMLGGSIINATGDGGVTVNAARNILLNSGSSITTVNGSIALTSNPTGTASGQFSGIDLNGATIESTNGNITLNGHGGDSGTALQPDVGVRLRNAAIVRSTGNGSISITGEGGDSNSNSAQGILLESGSQILSTSTAATAGSITLVGTSGTGTGNNARGIDMDDDGSGTLIQSVNGNISLTGTGRGTGGSNGQGIKLRDGSLIQ
ncbi:MAG: filamentous hemagglutinin N-terminal domain-containing protein, partial [Verrucomicrobiota bacterium]